MEARRKAGMSVRFRKSLAPALVLGVELFLLPVT